MPRRLPGAYGCRLIPLARIAEASRSLNRTKQATIQRRGWVLEARFLACRCGFPLRLRPRCDRFLRRLAEGQGDPLSRAVLGRVPVELPDEAAAVGVAE